MPEYLDTDQIVEIHTRLTELFSDTADPISPPGTRDVGLVESAAHRPRTSLGVTEKYTSLNAKAAALFHSLVKNHAFFNGNKRTALVSLLCFLDVNNCVVEATDDEVFDFVLAVAEDSLPGANDNADAPVEAIARWLKVHTKTRRNQATEMKIGDFLEKVRAAGGNYRESGPSWLVLGAGQRSLHISQSTRTLPGPVVKTYVANLGLSYGQTGVYIEEFQDGVDPKQQLIRKYRSVLNRLAHA